MLDGPDPVEAHLLGEDRLFHTVMDDLVFVFDGGIGELRLEDDGELHVASRELNHAHYSG